MAYTFPTIPAWLLPLLVLVVVCVVAGWSSFKKMMEGFSGSASPSAESCKTTYTKCMDASGTMTSCTDAYNKCMSAQGFTGAPVVAPTSPEPSAEVIAANEDHKKYLEEIKKRNAELPSPIPPTAKQLASIGGGITPGTVPDNYTPHVEKFQPHQMPGQTEGFTIQQMVRAPGT